MGEKMDSIMFVLSIIADGIFWLMVFIGGCMLVLLVFSEAVRVLGPCFWGNEPVQLLAPELFAIPEAPLVGQYEEQFS
jgi:hypothetical protein